MRSNRILGHMILCWAAMLAVAALRVPLTTAMGGGTPPAARPAPERPLPMIESTDMVKPARQVKMIQDGFLWIDAEDFADYGGWKLDTQFVHLMGSAYLLAPGVGQPVQDATACIEVPQAGMYRVWVRAKNWYPPDAPGRFQLSIDGQVARPIFGAAETDAWIWQTAGEFDLAAGPVQLALHDITGYFARCDALILTTDLSYEPPASLDAILTERSRLSGLSLEPAPAGEFDVIVVGGGGAGCCAAIASARLGAKTALIQDRAMLGGNASVELGVPINGAASMHQNARESGIIEEAGRIKARFGYPKMSEAFAQLAQQEKNLTVFLNRRVVAAEMQGPTQIAGVRAVDTLSGAMTSYRGKIFLDCTGDGWLGFFAGAHYRHGRESRDEFQESFAPEHADGINMSGCIMNTADRAFCFRSADTGHPVTYTPPPWAAKLPPANQFGRQVRHLGGEWWLEREGTIDTITQAEKSRDELIRISFAYFGFLKNHWAERQRAANHELVWVPWTEGKRESRRLIGDYVLNQNDTLGGTMFPDRVSYGGWPLDVHHELGIYSGPEGPFDCNAHVPIYSIPFRCLYSKNIDNLLFAARNMSVTHIALGTVRVQGTLSALGQAAGTAAAMCIQRQLSPRELGQQHIADLQQTLLKYDQYIPKLKNEDPRDIARQARVTASSTAPFEGFGRRDVKRQGGHELTTTRAVMFPRGMHGRLESVYLYLESACDEAVELTLHVRQSDRADEFSAARDTATSQATVPAKRQGYVEFRVDCDLEKPFVWVWLPAVNGITWSLMTSSPLGSCRAYGGKEGKDWTVVNGQYYAFYTEPALALERDFKPGNVINGVARIVGQTPNLWMSDPAQSLPQWIELDFDSPACLNAVYLTFDTDANASLHTVPKVPECVRDYELSYYDGAQWVSLASVRENFQRRRVHRFNPISTSRLRLSVTATNGSPSARVFEIRGYDD